MRALCFDPEKPHHYRQYLTSDCVGDVYQCGPSPNLNVGDMADDLFLRGSPDAGQH